MTEKKIDPFDLAAGVPAIEGDIRPTPKFADRISKRVILVAMIFFGMLAFIFMMSLDHMDKKKAAGPEKVAPPSKNDISTATAAPSDLTGGLTTVGASGVTTTRAPNLVMPQAASAVSDAGVPSVGKIPGVVPPISVFPPPRGAHGMIPKDNPPEASKPSLTPAQQAEATAQQERVARMDKAKKGGLSAKSFESGGGAALAGGGGVDGLKATLANITNNGGGGQQAAPAALPQKPQVEGEQDEKLDFIKKASSDDRNYHPYMQKHALSPNEVKTGSFIPLALEQGINSDLPGQITARVTSAVFDSITGCRELIPPLTTVVGKYDSKIAMGQGRMLVVWNSMIFPNGDELNLAGMQGYDTAGEAGLKSDVDNHYMKMFGLAFGMSMVTAGVQLSVPPPPVSTNGTVAPTTEQVVATALAQQYGQLGAQILTKQMGVQPTLRNFPGEQFIIMVPHTIVFNTVWSNRCNTVGSN